MKSKIHFIFFQTWESNIFIASMSGSLKGPIFNLTSLNLFQGLTGLLKYIILKIKIFLEHFDTITKPQAEHRNSSNLSGIYFGLVTHGFSSNKIFY